jgi:hypothetical protein
VEGECGRGWGVTTGAAQAVVGGWVLGGGYVWGGVGRYAD